MLDELFFKGNLALTITLSFRFIHSDSPPFRRVFKASCSKQSLIETKPSLHATLS